MKDKNNILKGAAIVLGIISSVITALLIILLLVFIFFPYKGRVGIHLPWGDDIVPPPPEKKLLQYMEDKYGAEFFQITEEEYSDEISEMDVWRWAHDDNGIIVRTDAYPGKYFYVRKWNGKITDNYGCCLVRDEAQQIIHDELADSIEYDFKIMCAPNYRQGEYDAGLTAMEYINNCNYAFVIYICSDGENRENDLEKIKPTLAEIFKNSQKSKHSISISYYAQEDFDLINTSWCSQDLTAADSFIWRGYGFLEDDSSEFEWYDN